MRNKITQSCYLCFRCEHRSRHIERKFQGLQYEPRLRCSNVSSSVLSCDMYMPTIPVTVEKEEIEKTIDLHRPMFANIKYLSARVKASKKPIALQQRLIKKQKRYVILWEEHK